MIKPFFCGNTHNMYKLLLALRATWKGKTNWQWVRCSDPSHQHCKIRFPNHQTKEILRVDSISPSAALPLPWQRWLSGLHMIIKAVCLTNQNTPYTPYKRYNYDKLFSPCNPYTYWVSFAMKFRHTNKATTYRAKCCQRLTQIVVTNSRFLHMGL